MARSTGYTYDPKTGKWTKSVSDSGSSSSNTTGNTSNSSNKTTTNTGTTSTAKTSTGNQEKDSNLTSSTSDKNDSTGQVEKKYNDIQINTLSGTLNFIVTEETIKLRVGDTVKLDGLGKYLSGNYYVKEITRTISNNGYSHSATVIKTNFGESLKIKSKSKKKSSNGKTVSSPSTSGSSKRTHTVKKGECLWGIAKYYYGDGALYNKIYDANTDKVANPKLIYVGQVLVIP